MSKTTDSSQRICGCGHLVSAHETTKCGQWWRYPDVLNARECGCRGAWRPERGDSRYEHWASEERRAGGLVTA